MEYYLSGTVGEKIKEIRKRKERSDWDCNCGHHYQTQAVPDQSKQSQIELLEGLLDELCAHSSNAESGNTSLTFYEIFKIINAKIKEIKDE